MGVQAMTTAIGFRCEDGIILAADSEISEGWGKYEESNIHRFTGKCFLPMPDVL
jgi:20S proteasome alpha/beta subunit